MKKRLLISVVGAMFLFPVSSTWGGVVVSATRFIFPEKDASVTITLTNKSDQANLISSKISAITPWQGAESSVMVAPPFIVTPLFLLQPNATGMLRVIKTENHLPSDRETLFALSIANIPPGKPDENSIKMATRSTFKLIWRPEALVSQGAENAYQQLKWSIDSVGIHIDNPTPFYITLTNVNVNGIDIADGGMVAPKQQRQTKWCQRSDNCNISWRTINDYGGLTPVMKVTLR